MRLLFSISNVEHILEIGSTSYESGLDDYENQLLFSNSEKEFEEDVAGSSSGLPREEVNF